MKCFPYLLRTHRSAPDLKLQGYSSTNPTSKNNPSSSSASSRSNIPELYEAKARYLRVFTFAELRTATNGFNRIFKIGEGGFGSVYKGLIKPVDGHGDRIVVAIKKLNNDGFQGHKEWISEVQFLGVVEHPNLVKLIGYCAVDEDAEIERLLVYEFMPNQSLEEHLFNISYPVLPWHTRLQIVLGAAQGLAYLHEESQAQVIYRDFKASNVLLDKNFKPKLSDFGLAREGPSPGYTHVSTAVMGTQGYAAPDYVETGHLTTKSDVWSFGVVLYEILTGRRSLEKNRPKKEQKLLEWVRRFPPGSNRFKEVIDPRLELNYSAREIAVLAESCLLKSAKDRPKMSEVAEKLKTIIRDYNAPPTMTEIGSGMDRQWSGDERDEEGDEASESEKRRITHLAKLGQHVEGNSRKGLMIMQRAKIGI